MCCKLSQALKSCPQVEAACEDFVKMVKMHPGGEKLGCEENNPWREGQGAGCTIQ